VSGDYDFKQESTWIMNADAWNGDPYLADFLVDPQFVPNVELQSGGGIALYLSPPATAGQPGDGCRLSSTSYMHYGVFTARLKSGTAPGGMVTSFISLSDVRDEIDWEWVGERPTKALTAFFHRGNVTRADSRGEDFDLDLATNEHSYEYSVDWNADRIIWSIDGVDMQTVTRESRGDYPSTPSRIQLGVWDAGASESIWTQIWAGGQIDWSQVGSKGYSAVIDYVSIRCAGDTTSTGQIGKPDRKEGFTAPSWNEIPINKAHGSAGSTAGADYFEPGTPLSERFTSSCSIRISSSVVFALIFTATFLITV